MQAGDVVVFLGNSEPYYDKYVGRTAIVERVGNSSWPDNKPLALVRFKDKRLINFYQENLEVQNADL